MISAHQYTPSTGQIAVDPEGQVAQLRASTAQTWEAAVEHRFVDELFAGTIDDHVLAGYLVQDYQFFDTFLSTLGGCVAYADQIPAKLRFSRQLGMLAADENDYFQRSFDELAVAEAERSGPELTPTTSAFRQAMTEATRSQSYPHLLVVLVIAEWLYLDWGQRQMQLPDRFVHREWIDLHRGTDFEEWVQFLIEQFSPGRLTRRCRGRLEGQRVGQPACASAG